MNQIYRFEKNHKKRILYFIYKHKLEDFLSLIYETLPSINYLVWKNKKCEKLFTYSLGN